MLNSTDSLRAFLGVEPIDLPKSFSGLFAVAKRRFKEDPLQGALLVFSNCSRTKFKMLYWDGTGLWVLVKRSEFKREKSIESVVCLVFCAIAASDRVPFQRVFPAQDLTLPKVRARVISDE